MMFDTIKLTVYIADDTQMATVVLGRFWDSCTIELPEDTELDQVEEKDLVAILATCKLAKRMRKAAMFLEPAS